MRNEGNFWDKNTKFVSFDCEHGVTLKTTRLFIKKKQGDSERGSWKRGKKSEEKEGIPNWMENYRTDKLMTNLNRIQQINS